MKLSNRVCGMQASPIRKLMPYANEAKKNGNHIYHLNIGQPDIKTPEIMWNAIHEFDESVLSYGPSAGLQSYRDGLAKYYQTISPDVTAADVMVTTAGSEGILFSLMAICDHDDEVIIPEPFYTNYNGFAQMAGVKVVPVTTYAEDGFHLPSKEKILEKVSDRTRAILLCNPGNPTGTVYSKEEMDMIASVAKEKGLFLIGDEVYREFVYGETKHISVLDYPELKNQSIVVDSISKRYSACGARIGCIVCRNTDFMAEVLKMAQARLCPPTLEQIAGLKALELDQTYFASVNEEYQSRRDLVYGALSKMDGVQCKLPEGAFYIIAKLPVESAEEFAIFMLQDFNYEGKTVMVSPAEGFYATPGIGKDEIRIAYILNREDLKDSMEILEKGLHAFNNR